MLAIEKELFSKFGILAQIHMDSGKNSSTNCRPSFSNFSMSSKQKLLQSSTQVEVLNKTVKKFLQSFLDNTTLNWETFLLALEIIYNAAQRLPILEQYLK